ncbi:hypothetical protein SERLADRAFT_432291 [Serpula lacrymans var. lacrymans S7.9]|uniref:Uncharacterized protein n=1 Tax=Serpula lacrymans var. lacrymans (strain S7.9) TaxID=578457 RepID=F8NEQ1_SERL9|nr:uncharacterized protein SERLADRAFT_432291 [Serpula lacrymans var. lacrymans S7.9]EGO30685.1 hypothetical protein SERLADRAFT_432291 [Serpula lacrymans var. lacrymans S7.9]
MANKNSDEKIPDLPESSPQLSSPQIPAHVVREDEDEDMIGDQNNSQTCRQQNLKAAKIQQYQNNKELHKQYMRLLQCIFKFRFCVGKDNKYALHELATRRDMIAFNRGDDKVSGPNQEDLKFDMNSDSSFEWNHKIFQYLLEDFK